MALRSGATGHPEGAPAGGGRERSLVYPAGILPFGSKVGGHVAHSLWPVSAT